MSIIPKENKETFFEESNNEINEEIAFSLSLNNCKEGISYKIEIINKEQLIKFETEEIKAENSEIKFNKKLNIKFFFHKRQILLINVIKIFTIDLSKFSKSYQRMTVLSSLINSKDCTYIRNIKENDINSEKLIIKVEKYNNNEENQFTIFDYLKSGIKLSMFISFDFSDSCDQKSKSETKNIILNILKNISNRISNYSYDKTFYTHGFGGLLKNEFERDYSNSIFNVNMNENDSSIKSYEKVFESYNNCLNNIISNAKIYLSPLIKTITKEILNLSEIKNYNISFIFVKDLINDIQKLINEIVASSYLPLTVIIIDLGKNNLNNNIINILSTSKLKKMRDNILYTSLFENHKSNIDYMIEWCLKEMVKQMLKFYELVECSPKFIQDNDLDKIKNNFKIYESNLLEEKENNIENEKENKDEKDEKENKNEKDEKEKDEKENKDEKDEKENKNEQENKDEKNDILNFDGWNGFTESINLNDLENKQTNNEIDNYCILNSNKFESIKEDENNIYNKREYEENEFKPHLRINKKNKGKNSNNISNFKTTNTELSTFNN